MHTSRLSGPRIWQAALNPDLGQFEPLLISPEKRPEAFPLVAKGHASPLIFDASDHKGVLRAIGDLRADITRVTDGKPTLSAEHGAASQPVLIGAVGRSARIDALLGVSPWYWWADVPVQHRDELHLNPGVHASGEPAVKYRGILINDEAPALRRWAQENEAGE